MVADPVLLLAAAIVLTIALLGGYLLLRTTPVGEWAASFLPETAAEGAPAAAAYGLSVVTAPAGATVYINLDSMGVTPVDNLPVGRGVYALSLEREGYARIDTMVVLDGSPVRFAFSLADRNLSSWERAEADSWMQTDRPSEVAAPYEASATTPANSRRAARPERTTATRSTSSRGSTGVLLVTSEPTGSHVLIDGELAGRTPLLLQSLRSGAHDVVVQQDGFSSFSSKIALKAGDTETVTARLQATTGQLIVRVQPWGSIYVDGELQRKDTDVQFTTDLPVGMHDVRVVHPSLGVWHQQVEVTGDAPQRIAVNFTGNGAAAAAPVPAKASEPAQTSPAVAETPRTEANATTVRPGDDGIYAVAEVTPQIIGGVEGLLRKARYPDAARQAGLEGRVFVRFVVDENGRVRNAHVARGLGLGCDEEALRLVNDARFVPGKIGGKAVPVWHAIAIRFQMPGK